MSHMRNAEWYTALLATAQRDGADAANRAMGWGPAEPMLLRMSYLAGVGRLRAATGRVLADQLSAYQRASMAAYSAAVQDHA